MSRTYRARRGDQYHGRPWGHDTDLYGHDWKRCDATTTKFFHSDGHWRDAVRGQIVKHVSARRRRADTRRETFHVMKDAEREYLDREGHYRKITWWYS